MTAIIVDDEKKAIDSLSTIIGLFEIDVDIIGTATSVEKAIELLSNKEPDILFLDIELKDGLGTEVLAHFPRRKFKTVFVTGYDQYAIEAFKLRAYNYLLKPVDPDELKTVIENLAEETVPVKPSSDKISVPTIDGIRIINVKEIIRLQADNYYTHIILKDEKPMLISRTLKKFDESMDSAIFLRVHQSHIVNFEHIVSYSKKEGGSLLLNNGDKVPVSKKNKPVVELALQLGLTSI